MQRASSSCDPSPLADRIRARRAELEQAVFARFAAISNRAVAPDPAYLAGIRAALTAALDYGLAAITSPDRAPEPVPVQLLGQARLAARNGVRLETVLRRYAAGHSLLADTLLDEAAALGIGAAELKSALRTLAAHYDRVVVSVGQEYARARESEVEPRSSRRRRYTQLRRLLAGERLDAGELSYEFDAHHLALVACGTAATRALALVGERFDRRLLLAEPDEQTAWAWLGGRRRFEERDIELLAAAEWPSGVAVGCGLCGQGLAGWRLSHRQAAAAMSVAQRVTDRLINYADVALLASALQDDLLLNSLDQLYLSRLSGDRDRGLTAKDTLRAYFAAAGNVSSAAAALGVNRRTIASRLTAIEESLGRPLDSAAAEIETALRLDEVGAFSS